MVLHQKLFFLLLVLLPTQLGFHFWPTWAYVLGRRVDYLSPTIFLTDIVLVFLLASWFFANKKFFPKKFTILFFFIAVINIFFAKSQPVAIYKWCKVLELVALGFYIVRTKPALLRVTYYLSLGVLYSSVIAVLQFLVQRSLGFWILGERTFSIDTPGIARLSWGREVLRSYSTFPHPNVLGGFLAVTLPLVVYRLRRSAYKIITSVLGVAAFILSFSRSAWIALLIGLSLTKRKFLLPCLFLLFVLGFGFRTSDESVIVRTQLNKAAISMWQKSPIVGVGLGNFLVELPKYLVSRDVYFLQPVHNIYLLVLAETGIIGAALFAWVIIRGFKKFNPLFIGFLLLGLVDHYPLTIQQGQILFTILLVLQ